MEPSKTYLPPTQVAPDTFLVHDHVGEGEAPVAIPINSLLIRAEQPVLVDSGFGSNRERYLADVFSFVDPEDVRWVFLSHDDVDHSGNINELMVLCPNATLVLNWFMVERMGKTLEVAPSRWRWMGDGESLDVGDRALRAVRPPIFDSPTTRGLFDDSTGVYWAVDAFATPMLTPAINVTELEPDFWLDGMAMLGQYVSPWLELVDDTRFQQTVDRVAELAPAVIVGCHTPAITGSNVDHAIANTRGVPTATVPSQPDQAALEVMQAAIPAH